MPSYPEAGCGAAIFDAAGRLLLIQRLKEPEAGAWGLPGGKIDYGEAARDATKREIAEELGVEIEIGRLACIAEILDGGDGRHWVSPIFFARVVSGTPSLMEPEKHGGFGWYDTDSLPHPLTTPTRALLDTLKSPVRPSPAP
jgi:8-oxo-dGTP diphosphatase